MIFKVEISNQADIDFEIFMSILHLNCNLQRMRVVCLTELEKSIMGLDQMPERFRKYEKEP